METASGKAVSKIGIGSYGVGGRGHRDMPITEKESDQRHIDALVYTLEKGSNFTEISVGYSHGTALALFKRALDSSSLSREDILVTHSLYPRDLPSLGTIKEDVATFYKVMDTDYADSTLVTESLIIRFGERPIYKLLQELLRTEKTRYVSLSNASPNWIHKFKKEFGDKFLAHEGHLSFEIRALQDKGVFETCDSLNVENIIWRPLRRNKTFGHNWPLLVELAKKYHQSQSQVILNWICHLGYRPMVFSTSTKHIDENISAVQFRMSDEDYERLNSFRPENYNPPQIDWEGVGIDEDIVGLVKGFEDHIAGRVIPASSYWLQ